MRERPSPPTAHYSITGAVAKARLVPLLEEMKEVAWHPAAAAAAATTTTTIDTKPHQPLHFVWETHLPRHLKHEHGRAQVRNRLANSSILEEKGHLAHLMAQIPLPRLETYILHAKEVQGWLDDRKHKQKEEWWILKATGGNGAMDIHLLPPCHPSVPPSLHLHPGPYVMQQYLTNPVLYEGKYKFHFRVYALLRITKARTRNDGNDSSSSCSYIFEPRLYHHAYILRSSLPYDQSNQKDDLIHLTNLSLHKKAPSYPGQIPVDLPRDFPEVYEQMKKTWAALIKAAAPFMRVQTSANHFEFFGLDFLLAEEQQVYLLEVNRLPGLQSSRQNFAQEEILYNEMMRGLLRLCVCPPLVARSGDVDRAQDEEEEDEGWERVMADAKESDQEEDLNVDLDPEGKGLYKNILKFGLYVKRNKL